VPGPNSCAFLQEESESQLIHVNNDDDDGVLSFEPSDAPGSIKWDLGSELKLWKEMDKQTSVSTSSPADVAPSQAFFVEGVDTGEDIEIKATYDQATYNLARCEDRLLVTVVTFVIGSPGNPYNNAGSHDYDNLLGAWPGQILRIRVYFSPSIQENDLPPNYVTWSFSTGNSISPNELEAPAGLPNPGSMKIDVTIGGQDREVRIHMPDTGSQTLNEVSLIDPYNAFRIGFYGLAADQYAANTGLPGAVAGQQNAIKHSYWNATAAFEVGVATTLWFTTAYEHTNKQNGGLAHDTVMDLHNNSEGTLTAQALGAPNQTIPVGAIKANLNARLNRGDLWIINNTTHLIEKSNGEKIY